MDNSASLLQPLLGLIATFVIMGLVLWAVKSLQNKRNIFGSRSIQVIEAASVGTRERIVIADVGGRRLVLGVTAQNVNLLTELEAQPLGEPTSDSTEDAVSLSFSERLRGSINALSKTKGKL